MNTKEAQDLLEAFICDKDLKELEQMFGKFNIFDCLKLTRTEIRHSNFLAWLLDPNETHGLKDYFLKEFLKHILKSKKKEIAEINGKEIDLKNSENPDEIIKRTYSVPSIFDIDYWDMTETEIFRELEYIDLLLVDEKNKFVFIIENKIDSFQHSNQLARYRDYVDEQYPNTTYQKLFIYLKPKKETVEKPYIYLSYQTVRDTIKELIDDKNDKISDEILVAIKHYQEVLERDIMNSEDELTKICRQIYRKHKSAIDLISQYGNPRNVIFEILEEVLEEQEDLIICNKENNAILCLPANIEERTLEKLKFGNWKPNDFIIQLHFMNFKYGHSDLCFEILISPANCKENEEKRSTLLNNIKTSLKVKFKNEAEGWPCTNPISLLTMEQYMKCNTRDEIKNHIKKVINESKKIYIDKLRDVLNEFCK